MNTLSIFFSMEQGNLLVRLVLAHLLSDFVVQTAAIAKHKAGFNKHMLVHVLITFIAALVLSQSWVCAIGIGSLHWLIDIGKVILQKKYPEQGATLFIADQVLHLLSIVFIWTLYCTNYESLLQALAYPFTNYKISLLLAGYAFIIWPVGFLLKFILQDIYKDDSASTIAAKDTGKLIGQCERVIILTFVLLNQYEAIGFLITGKSIIRFSQRDEQLKSEYILVGTMMSYACSILTGIGINWLLAIAN